MKKSKKFIVILTKELPKKWIMSMNTDQLMKVEKLIFLILITNHQIEWWKLKL